FYRHNGLTKIHRLGNRGMYYSLFAPISMCDYCMKKYFSLHPFPLFFFLPTACRLLRFIKNGFKNRYFQKSRSNLCYLKKMASSYVFAFLSEQMCRIALL